MELVDIAYIAAFGGLSAYLVTGKDWAKWITVVGSAILALLRLLDVL